LRHSRAGRKREHQQRESKTFHGQSPSRVSGRIIVTRLRRTVPDGPARNCGTGLGMGPVNATTERGAWRSRPDRLAARQANLTSLIQSATHRCRPLTVCSSLQSTWGWRSSSSRSLSRYRVCAARGIRPTAGSQFEPGHGDSIKTNGHSSGGCVCLTNSVKTSRAFLNVLTHTPSHMNDSLNARGVIASPQNSLNT
jgi:hypothetical protein